MRRQDFEQLPERLMDLLAPALRIGLGERHPSDQRVKHELEQLLPAGDVGVEGGGAGS